MQRDESGSFEFQCACSSEPGGVMRINVPADTLHTSPVSCIKCNRRYYVLDGALTCDTSWSDVRPRTHVVTRMPGIPALNNGLVPIKINREGKTHVLRSARRLIGIAGYRGSGKDTVARIITGRFPALSGMRRIAYADTLRDAVGVMYGWSTTQMLDPALKEQVDPFWGISPRDALRLVGTDCMRKIAREDFWLRAVDRRMEQIQSRSILPVRGYVIPDVRFENELQHVRDQGGEIWVIYRPGCEFDGHVTEELPRDERRFDRVIENTGSLCDLKRKVKYLLSLYGTLRHARVNV